MEKEIEAIGSVKRDYGQGLTNADIAIIISSIGLIVVILLSFAMFQ